MRAIPERGVHEKALHKSMFTFTLPYILGTGFYKSNDPNNSVKALKKDRS